MKINIGLEEDTGVSKALKIINKFVIKEREVRYFFLSLLKNEKHDVDI